MEIVSGIVTPVIESLMSPIRTNIGYLTSCRNNVTEMVRSMKELDGIKLVIENHVETNNIHRLQIPDAALDWMKEVEKIKVDVEAIPTDFNGCFNLKMRYEVGRKASKMIQEIKRLMKNNSEIIIWTDHPIPLAVVDSQEPSTSAQSYNDFESRSLTFERALKALQPYDKTCMMIALCGMGGVGKTTMMEQLKKAVEETKTFDYVVKAVIGEKTDPIFIQQAIGDYIVPKFEEKTQAARADKLHKTFERMSDNGRKKILVILDDVWNVFDLKDIGLSPLPNGGVGFKFLLTSRDEDVCSEMGVETNSIFKVKVMNNPEAQDFFRQMVGISSFTDPELNQICEDIVRKCGGLPLAIKILASTLKNKSKPAWRDALSRLNHNILKKNVREIFEMSYKNLKNEEVKSFFLLCGLFPDDFDIPIEDLARYGWGLKLFKDVDTFEDARNRSDTYSQELRSTNLLIESNLVGCVKLHDLVLAFVVRVLSEGVHASVVNPDNLSGLTTEDKSKSCERISLTCTGMTEFPQDFNYPNITLLKLMHGDRSLRFPEGFYGRMQKLKVVAYENMRNSLLLESLECKNIQTLCLHSCSLADDISAIENLKHLEILSLVECNIRKLSSSIGKLEWLRLLELTGYADLRIDEGVFGSLARLEELYIIGVPSGPIRFTHANCNELEKLSKNLSALQVEFFENMAHPKKLVFKNLKRFRISLGCHLEENKGNDKYSFKNMLMLVTNRSKLLELKINELFGKTEILHLQVDGMNDLQDVSSEEDFINLKMMKVAMCKELVHFGKSLFHNLRALEISDCKNLRYAFSLSVARGLSTLERLEISRCRIMEEVIHVGRSEKEAVDTVLIKFCNLMYLSLDSLGKLASLCNDLHEIELPQLLEMRLRGLPNFTSIYSGKKSAPSPMSSHIANQPFFSEKVTAPKLEILNIQSLENLRGIWPSHYHYSEDSSLCTLREVKVCICDSLVNLFPTNPLSLLHHLEELDVVKCGLIEEIFNVNVERVDGNNIHCYDENQEGHNSLRRIKLTELRNLRYVWRIEGVDNSDQIIHGFEALRSISIETCKDFRHVFTPSTTNIDLIRLEEICITHSHDFSFAFTKYGFFGESSRSRVISRPEEGKITEESIRQGVNVVFPSHLIPIFHHLRGFQLEGWYGVEVVFEIDPSNITIAQQQLLLLPPHMTKLELISMDGMSHVWKCNWKKLLLPTSPQLGLFHNLTEIEMHNCRSIKYLFSPLMAKLFSKLQSLHMSYCEKMEEIVSNIDDGDVDEGSREIHNTTTFPLLFPQLNQLTFYRMPSLKRIGGGGGSKAISSNTTASNKKLEDFPSAQKIVASWSLCQYSREIDISRCHELSSVFPSHSIGHMRKLKELIVDNCYSMEEIFEAEGINNNNKRSSSDTSKATIPVLEKLHIENLPKLKYIFGNNLIFPNLTFLVISDCCGLEHIFTCSTVESLKQLKELTIARCNDLQVIVKEEDDKHTDALGVMTTNLTKVLAFPRLQSLTLENLPNLKGVFLGMHDFQWPLLDCVMINCCHRMSVFTSGKSTTPKIEYIYTVLGKYTLEGDLNFTLTTAAQTRFSGSDRIDQLLFPCSFSNLIQVDLYGDYDLVKIFPSKDLLKLQKLEKLSLVYSHKLVEVFEVVTGTENDTRCVVEFPSLKQVDLRGLMELKHIWRSQKWTVLEFPNLTSVEIEECRLLGHVFTSSMVGSLLHLQVLKIENCKEMEVVVKEEEEEVERRVKVVVFSCLKYIQLKKLPNLKCFCLGKEAYDWPSLNTLEIYNCPNITVFTNGQSSAPKLKVIDTYFGIYSVMEGDPNFAVKSKIQEGFNF